jgi:hypothetical protein
MIVSVGEDVKEPDHLYAAIWYNHSENSLAVS